jgi:hypothetical protein
MTVLFPLSGGGFFNNVLEFFGIKTSKPKK